MWKEPIVDRCLECHERCSGGAWNHVDVGVKGGWGNNKKGGGILSQRGGVTVEQGQKTLRRKTGGEGEFFGKNPNGADNGTRLRFCKKLNGKRWPA